MGDSESSEDFSASTDEWCNGEEEEDEEDSDISSPLPEKRRKVMTRSSKASGKRSSGSKFPSRTAFRLRNKALKNQASGSIKARHAEKERNAENADDSSSDCSIDEYLVDPADIDLDRLLAKNQSQIPEANEDAMHTIHPKNSATTATLASNDARQELFDFQHLVNSTKAYKPVKDTTDGDDKNKDNANTVNDMDVGSLLALGENDKSEEGQRKAEDNKKREDANESDWEEVDDDDKAKVTIPGKLEIIVEDPTRKRKLAKPIKSQLELELAFRRRINNDMKRRQLLLHKSSLLCNFGRIFNNNRILNDDVLMKTSLKLLHGKNAYPPKNGTDLKYYQSLVIWFKTVIKLKNENLYPEQSKGDSHSSLKAELLNEIKEKQANCKQNMIFIFISLLRGMGLQCRLVGNIQPIALRPNKSDLLSLKRTLDDNTNLNDKNKKLTEKTVNKKTNANEVKFKDIPETGSDSKSNKKPNGVADKTTTIEKSKKKTQEKITNTKAKNVKDKTVNNLKNKESIEEEIGDNNLEPITNNIESNKKTEEKISHSKVKKVKDRTINNLKDKESHGDEIENNHLEPITTKEQPIKEKTMVKRQKTLKDLKATLSHDNAYVRVTRSRSRSRSKSPRPLIDCAFLKTAKNQDLLTTESTEPGPSKPTVAVKKSVKENKIKISADFLKTSSNTNPGRVLRCRNKQQAHNDANNNNDNNNINGQKKGKDVILLEIPQLDGADDIEKPAYKTRLNRKKRTEVAQKADLAKEPPKQKRTKRNEKKTMTSSEEEDDDEDDYEDPDVDEEFIPSPPKKAKKSAQKKPNRKAISSDESDQEENDSSKKIHPSAEDLWVEVYSDVEQEWLCVNLFKGVLHSTESIAKSASSNLEYVYAFGNDLSIKDVTARYCADWAGIMRKSRVDHDWLESAISEYFPEHSDRDLRENQELRRLHEGKPLPKAIYEFKNNPLYVLERHLLQFEALYPREPQILGFVRGEAIYSRDCVHLLHSREIWLKQARVVKLGEQPYKIVKRPKWDKFTQTILKDQPLDVFGFWQTEEYQPPTAENGVVPRNAYGNVELFKESMLPKKTVHLRLPGLPRICKKLGIDCAPAVVGFDFNQGWCHPTFDGFVVCEEFADQVTAAWKKDSEEQEQKEIKKYEARVYGNWKKLVRGLLIREKIKIKYNL